MGTGCTRSLYLSFGTSAIASATWACNDEGKGALIAAYTSRCSCSQYGAVMWRATLWAASSCCNLRVRQEFS